MPLSTMLGWRRGTLQLQQLSQNADARMTNRTIRFAVLGMSISLLLEITAAHDFLRALLSLLSDFDAVEDDDTIKVKTVSQTLSQCGRFDSHLP